MSSKNQANKTRSHAKRAIKVTAPSPKVSIVCVGGFGEHALSQLGALLRLDNTPTAAAPIQIPPASPAARFTKVSAAGALLPDSATEWEGVFDRTTGLVWGRALLPGETNWSDSVKKAAKATLCGAAARAPTIQERLSIFDYERCEPALDTNYFAADETSAWEWTSTPAKSPSGYAWSVYLGDGNSNRNGQCYRFHVRAVRAGQF